MVSTYTTDWFQISDGDTTTHDPQSLAPTTDEIRILGAEIRWEGDSTSTTNYNTDYKTNTNSDTATAVLNTDQATATNSDSATATTSTETESKSDKDRSSGVPTATFPSPSSGYTQTGHSLEVTVFNFSNDDGTAGVTYQSIDGNSNTESVSISSFDSETIYSATTNSNYVGDDRSALFDGSAPSSWEIEVKITTDAENGILTAQTATATYPSLPSGYSFDRHELDIDGNQSTVYNNRIGQTESATSNSQFDTVTVELKTIGTASNVSSRTASTSYPSPPSGYTFNRHRHREIRDGNEEIDDFIYSNRVGQSESITSNNTSNQVKVELRTQGKRTTSNTVTTDTQDPSVSGDVSADAGNITVGDNNTTSWYTLGGLSAGSESFNHDINGSGHARFKFRFDWENARPDPPSNVTITDDTTEEQLTIDWEPVSDASGYYVYRAQSSGSSVSDYTQVADITNPPYTDTALEDGELYYYRVSAYT